MLAEVMRRTGPERTKEKDDLIQRNRGVQVRELVSL